MRVPACLLACLLLAAALCASFSLSGQAEQQSSGPAAWLVTYGPGQEMWERFGHNAIWVRDEARGLDRIYSYGYFDMTRPGFAWDFARGIMIYEGNAADPGRELAWYRGRDRSVRLQRLDLDGDRFNSLAAMLEQSLEPDQRQYQYDYYFDNCSTRLRDFIDRVTDGALSEATETTSTAQNFRDHTHRLTQQRFWLHTGMMMGLGPAVDKENSAWEEMFLPEALAREVGALETDRGALVAEDFYWHESETFDPPPAPSHRWLTYSGLGVATMALILLPAWRFRRPWAARSGLALYALASGAAGSVLLFLWLATSHEAAWANAFLLLLNPLWWLLLVPLSARVTQALVGVLGALMAAGAIILAWPESYQFRPAPLLWLVPAGLAALACALAAVSPRR